MKKFVVFLMVVGLVIAGRGMALADLSWSIPTTLSVTQGSEVTVPVSMSVSEPFDLGAISLTVLYDSSKFNYVGWSEGTWTGILDESSVNGTIAGKFIAGNFYLPTVPITASGTLLTFTLQAMTNALLGGYDVTFDPSQGSNEVAGGDFNPVALSLNNGSITVTAAPVPIPAAVWLLGSGLVGLVGIRRRFQK